MVKGGSAFDKNNRREIRRTLGRFLAILAIVALGVGFFTGLKLARPAMAKTGDSYLRKTNFYDYQLLSTVGFTDENVDYYKGLDFVTAAEGSVNGDLLTTYRGQQVVFKTHQLLNTINQVELLAGRMPEAADECLGDYLYFTEDDLGQVLTVENDDDHSFSQTQYTLVGICSSPQYLNIQRGTTSLGTGTVAAFLFLPAEGYDAEAYSEIFLTVENDAEAFSDDYDAAMAQWEDTLEDAVEEQALARRVQLLADGEVELADGWQEYYDGLQEYLDGKSEADTELSDAKVELEDALQELNDGEADYEEGVATLAALREDPLSNEELADARKELDDGWQQYYDGLREYEDGLQEYEDAVAENQPKLDDAKIELEDALQELNDGEADYEEGAATLAELRENPYSNEDIADARKELQDGWQQYRENLSLYNDYVAMLDEQQDKIDQAKAARDALMASGTATPEEIQQAQTNVYMQQMILDKMKEEGGDPDEAKTALDAARKQLMDGQEQLDESIEKAIAQGEQELADARKELDDGWVEYYDGLREYEDGVQELADAKQELDDAKKELDDALQELYQGEADYKTGYEDALVEGDAELADARKELDDGWQEYYDGLQEYADAKAEAETELADAKQELDDALEELTDGEADLKSLRDDPLSTYALDRTANSGYSNFNNDTSIVEGLAAIFPVFFFLVAALVCSSTMSRMVDEQRTHNGTLKALGYSDGAIIGRFATYAGLAAIIGCLIGFALGSWLFPVVIWDAYQMIYRFSDLQLVFDPVLGLLSLAVSLLCSVGVACATAYSEMRKMPAALMRPKSPKAGKRIFLEYLTLLWRRLGFLEKVSARNVFRYKKRLFMMILGVGGCLALLLAGLGLQDSIANVAEDQYSTITRYDYTITFDDAQTAEQQAQFKADWADSLEYCAFAATETCDTLTRRGVSSTNVVATDDPAITELFGLTYKGQSVPWPTGEGAVISEKLATLSGIDVGDSLTVQRTDGTVVEIPVVGLFENYVNHYIFLSPAGYETWMGETPDYATAFATAASDDIPYTGAQLSQVDAITNVTLAQDFKTMIADTMQSLDAVIALVVACALALSFVVSYNLININITERVREIATIKVLGFYRGETYSYVFREALVLTVMGCIAGIPMGIWLHRFVMERVQVDMVSFRVRIEPGSYALALGLTLLIALVVDAMLIRKIDRIHMAESLKSVE